MWTMSPRSWFREGDLQNIYYLRVGLWSEAIPHDPFFVFMRLQIGITCDERNVFKFVILRLAPLFKNMSSKSFKTYSGLNLCVCLVKSIFGQKITNFLLIIINPKVWFLILPSSRWVFPCKLVMRIWYKVKKLTSS